MKSVVLAVFLLAQQTPQHAIDLIEQGLAALKEALKPAPISQTITVPAGGDLDAVLQAAVAPSVIELAPGAVYIGNFVLRSGVTLQTAIAENQPSPGIRIGKDANVAWLQSPNSAPALRVAAGSHDMRVERIGMRSAFYFDIATCGEGQQDKLSDVPTNIVYDRVLILGDPVNGQKRGLALNCADATVTDSYIAGIAAEGQDAQALGAWSSPGPLTITNNYLEASGENFMLGGSDPLIPNLVTADVLFELNYVSKPLDWRTKNYSVKNLLELKNAKRVTIRGNVFENNWGPHQSGNAIMLTGANQDGLCTWCANTDILIENNIVRHVGGGVSITGHDWRLPSGQTKNVTLRNNLIEDCDGEAWGPGHGIGVTLSNGPLPGFVMERNTIKCATGFLSPDNPGWDGLVVTGNAFAHGAYGLTGWVGRGNDLIAAFLPNFTFTGNAIIGAPYYGDASHYPSGNLFQETWANLPAGYGVDVALLPDVAKVIAGH